jgi:hypothetical protein
VLSFLECNFPSKQTFIYVWSVTARSHTENLDLRVISENMHIYRCLFICSLIENLNLKVMSEIF